MTGGDDLKRSGFPRLTAFYWMSSSRALCHEIIIRQDSCQDSLCLHHSSRLSRHDDVSQIVNTAKSLLHPFLRSAAVRPSSFINNSPPLYIHQCRSVLHMDVTTMCLIKNLTSFGSLLSHTLWHLPTTAHPRCRPNWCNSSCLNPESKSVARRHWASQFFEPSVILKVSHFYQS